MKRLSILACAASVLLAGCNGKISPVAPIGVVTLVAPLSGAAVVPPPSGPEALGVGSATFSIKPNAAGTGYDVTYVLTLGNMPATTVVPGPGVIVAGVIYAGGPGALPLTPVYQTTISQTAPLMTPTTALRLDFQTNPLMPKAVGDMILANPSGFFFQLHSAMNQNGMVRGYFAKQ
jgi:hypothetical protein